MRIPIKPIAVGAALARRGAESTFANTSAGGQVIMASSGQIHLANFDGTHFTNNIKATVSGAPTWVEYVEPNLIYAVNENGDDLSIFNVETLVDGAQAQPAVSATGSSGVVHLEFSPDRSRLVGAGYGAGTIDIWNTENDQLQLIKTIPSPGQPGPGQSSAHPHQSVLDPTGRFFLVNDLGTDELYLIDSADDKWEIVTTVSLPAGSGPRHGVFFPVGSSQATHYFVANELSNKIISYTLTYTGSGIDFVEAQTISTFAGETPSGAAAGELVISPDGKSLYVSNRLTGGVSDNITRFQIAQDGSLAVAEETPTGGVLPRMFSLSAEGLIYVGNQNGPDAVSVFSTSPDGAVVSQAIATLPLSQFGEQGFGPAYIKQIS